MTSRYNALFLAKEDLREVEQKIKEAQVFNYDAILPVYPPFDSTIIRPLRPQLHEVVKKASLVIEWHGNSKWVDDAWLLIGMARYYLGELSQSIETLKYVNVQSEDIDLKHQALIFLMRVYIADGRYKLAEEVGDYLRREEMIKENLRQYYLAQAHLNQLRNDYDKVVKNLTEAAPLSRKTQGRARNYFILAQVNQQLGFDGAAYSDYQKVIQNTKDFELAFYARLYRQQVIELKKSGDLARARKFYESLLKETKNEEYRDRIFIEMGNFELRQDNIALAIKHYEMAISESQNMASRGTAYLKIAQINANIKKDFEKAKFYYDSAVVDLPGTYPGYEQILSQSNTLDQWYEYSQTVKVTDSLLTFSNLREDELQRIASTMAEKKKAELDAIEAKKKQAETTRSRNMLGNLLGRQTGDRPAEGSWYFYNASARSQGASEFSRVWGNRRLEDNWRRSQKTSSPGVSDQNPSQAIGRSTQVPEVTAPAFDEESFIEEFIAKVPKTEEEKKLAIDQIETALFEKGKLLRLEMNENELAEDTFISFLDRFPDSRYEPEVLYLLYLINKDSHPTKANTYLLSLSTKFPSSIYTLAISNPDFMGDTDEISDKLKDVYRTAYYLIKSEQFQQAQELLRAAYLDYPISDFSDNLKFLELIVLARSENEMMFREALTSFRKDFPESELAEFAENLGYRYEVRKSETYQLVMDGYLETRIAPFYLILVPGNTSYSIDLLSEELIKASFNLDRFSMIRIDEVALQGELPVIMVSGFQTFDQAMALHGKLNTDPAFKSVLNAQNLPNFVIDAQNMERFYLIMDVAEYLTFFEKTYKR
jgi:tetratricopeptide (TPR) repeat protein